MVLKVILGNLKNHNDRLIQFNEDVFIFVSLFCNKTPHDYLVTNLLGFVWIEFIVAKIENWKLKIL